MFFDFGEPVGRRNLTRHNLDGPGRTNEFAKLTGDTADSAVRVANECGGATVMFGQALIPFLLGILHRHFRSAEEHVLEMVYRDNQTAQHGWQIDSFSPGKLWTSNRVSHRINPSSGSYSCSCSCSLRVHSA